MRWLQAVLALFQDDSVTLHHALAVHLVRRHVDATLNCVRINTRSFISPSHSTSVLWRDLCFGTAYSGEENLSLMDIPLWEAELARSRSRAARGLGRRTSLTGRFSSGGLRSAGNNGVLVVFEDTIAFSGDGRFGMRIRYFIFCRSQKLVTICHRWCNWETMCKTTTILLLQMFCSVGRFCREEVMHKSSMRDIHRIRVLVRLAGVLFAK